MKPSPRPWKVGVFEILDANGVSLGGIELLDRTDGAEDIDRANAEHIVRCVNLHDELVGRLEAMCDLAELQGGFDDEDGWKSIARSREVLEKARNAGE